jgi:hypothetical protein
MSRIVPAAPAGPGELLPPTALAVSACGAAGLNLASEIKKITGIRTKGILCPIFWLAIRLPQRQCIVTFFYF